MFGSFGFLFLPSLMQIYGRKFINVATNLILIIGWLIIAFSPNVLSLIAGRAFQGLAFGSLYICGIITSEYSHPKRRGFFVVFKQAATGVGELFCHGFGFSITWREMACLAIIPAAISAVLTLCWKESPSWLAYKERYEECALTFEWLRGQDPESKIEMRKLVLAQQEMKRIRKLKGQGTIIRLLTSIRSKALLKPFRVIFLAIVLAHICGRHFLQAEVTQIMVSLTGNRSEAYFYTIAFDCMKIMALVVSSYVVRKFTRRKLLFYSGYSACFLLGSFCLVNLLVSRHVICITWLTPLLLILFNVVCYLGIIPLAMVFKGELFPLEHKGMGVTLVGLTSSVCSMVLLKSTSKLLQLLEPHGTFSIYLIIALSCLVCLHFILPETKDRTLQDIELEFTNIKIRNGNNCGEATGELVGS